MIRNSIEYIISTILSYSSDQGSYVKPAYIEGNIIEQLSKTKIDDFDTLISNLALEYLTEFSKKAKENMEIGNSLNSVHILNTFEFFLSTEERKAKIQQIFAENRKLKFNILFGYTEISFDAIKEKSIKGFCYFLQKNHEDANIEPYLSTFAKKVHKDEKDLRQLIEDKKYQEFFHKVLLED